MCVCVSVHVLASDVQVLGCALLVKLCRYKNVSHFAVRDAELIQLSDKMNKIQANT